MPTLYVIKNCDTCRRARRALDQMGIAHRVHDLREDGLTPELLAHLLDRASREELLNKRSTTWRALDAATRAGADDDRRARELLLAHPTLLKRPVLDLGDSVRIGYRDGDYDDLQG